MTQHPTLETLTGYVLSPQDQEYRELRRHLLDCEHCRQRSDQLSALTRKLQHDVPRYRYTDNAINETVAQSVTEQTLTDAQRQKLKQSPSAMKAALHSLTHGAAMQRALRDPSTHISTHAPASQSTSDFPKGLTQWWRQLFDWHNPAWVSIPVTAVLVFALTITLAPQLTQHNAQPVVTAYQDNPIVTLQAAGSQRPGIGFFSNTPSTIHPFTPVNIALSADSILSLSWPTITNAVSYTVQIAEIQNGTSIQVFQQSTPHTRIQFTAFKPHPGRRYTWTIGGQTEDGQQFRAQGGFVIQ